METNNIAIIPKYAPNNMQKINFSSHLLKEPVKSKAKFSYQALADEIAAKYQVPWKRFIWLFHRVEEWKVRNAFKEADTVENLIKFSLNQK